MSIVHSLRELLSKLKSPVSDAFDSNVNNSNAVNISIIHVPYLSEHFRLQKYTISATWQNIFSQSKEKVYFCSRKIIKLTN